MLSFKHHLAAAFVVGSLLSGSIYADGEKEQKQSFLQKYENEIRWGLALGAGALVWKAATYESLIDVANSTAEKLVHLPETSLFRKVLAKAHPYAVAIPKFAEHRKHAIQVTTAAVLLARYGKNALNGLVEGLKFHNMKQNFPNSWLSVPAEEKAAKAA